MPAEAPPTVPVRLCSHRAIPDAAATKPAAPRRPARRPSHRTGVPARSLPGSGKRLAASHPGAYGDQQPAAPVPGRGSTPPSDGCGDRHGHRRLDVLIYTAPMQRRAFLRTLAGTALAAPAATLLTGDPAEAATEYVMATEQVTGRILRFNPAQWSGGTVLWKAPSRTGTWTNLSDV